MAEKLRLKDPNFEEMRKYADEIKETNYLHEKAIKRMGKGSPEVMCRKTDI